MDVKTMCLGVLSLGDATGYEIRKQFEDGPFAFFHAAGYGSIYPALGRLDADGLVSCTEMAQDGRPDKKVYSITEAGSDAFRKALHKVPTEDKIRSEALFMLFFADLLDVRAKANVYDSYLENYRALFTFMEEHDVCGASGGRCFVHGFGLAIYRAIVGYMEANRHLLFEDEDASSGPVRMTGTDQ